ncbi:MAG: peptidylprolyl isomerase [Gammaproteobacteria bacterium]|nr:peptidylprolyl isomerase [Gammaproteobacteria bacterium]
MENQLTQIDHGSRVTLHIKLTLEDGSEVINTFDDEPSTLIMGGGDFAQGLEESLHGLTSGAKETMNLPPEQAFGSREEGKLHPMPLTEFGKEMALEPGLVIAFETPGGEELAGIVVEMNDTHATLDFNHPLAGQTVIFEVEILEVEPPGESE